MNNTFIRWHLILSQNYVKIQVQEQSQDILKLHLINGKVFESCVFQLALVRSEYDSI